MGSHKVASKCYFNTENSQIVSIGAILLHISHKAAKFMAKLISWLCYELYSWLSACQGKMEPFEDQTSTSGHLTSLANKPQQKHTGKISAPISALFNLLVLTL